MKYIKLLFCFFLFGVICFHFSNAFVSVSNNKIIKKAQSKGSNKNVQKELNKLPAWQKFKERYGEDWQVHWNEKTGMPHRVFGQKGVLESIDKVIRMRGVDKVLDSGYIERVSRAFIEQNKGLFQVSDGELHLQRSKRHGSTWYVTFWQVYKGVRVYNSRVDFQYDGEGKLSLFGADVFPEIALSISPTISKEKAVDIVQEDVNYQILPVGRQVEEDNISDPELLIYPEEEEKGFRYYLVWRLNVKKKNPVGDWVYFIDANSGEIRLKYNNIKYGIGGKISGYILPHYATDTPQEVPFPYESVSASPYSSTIYYEWKFDSSPAWATQGGWEFDSLDGSGTYETRYAYTGLYVYGYNVNGNYENYMDSTLYLTTPPIDCSNIQGTTLKFYRYLQIESLHDSATIEVSNNGSDWTVIWKASTDFPFDYSWTLKSYDISKIADGNGTVYIRWGIGPTDGSVNYGGWNIDDVQITNGFYKNTSNNEGNYSINTIPGNYSLITSLLGKYFNVKNSSGDEAYFSTFVSDGGIQNIVWDVGLTSLGGYDEMNVYYHAMKMHDYIKSIDSDFTGMDYSATGSVHLTNDPDINNAYWDGSGFAFGAGDGKDWRNLALFADVIYHEYTHGVTDKLYAQEGGDLPYIDGTESGAMSEGFSDYWACTITGDSKIGEGLLINKLYLRDIDNNLVYPSDMVGEVHYDGRIIAGAMWKMREKLGYSTADRLFHFARYGLPTTFNDFLIEVLKNDDDNDNLKDGTPHSISIYSAFGAHGISGIQLKSVLIDDKEGGNDNGELNSGETVKLVVTLENGMWEEAREVQGVLSINDNLVSVVSQNGNFSNIRERGGVGNNSLNPFVIKINNSIPGNYVASFNLNITDDQGHSFDLSLNFKIRNPSEKRWRLENISMVDSLPIYAGSKTLTRDRNGNLHTVYGVDYLYYAFYSNNKWEIKLLDNSNLHAYMASVALNKEDIPYVVFRDYNGESLKYGSLLNGKLKIETIDSTGYAGFYPSLVFDNNNNPHISYYQYYSLSDGSLKYAYHNGQVWQVKTIDTGSDTGRYPSIIIDSDNLPGISYYSYYSSDLRYARNTGSAWEIKSVGEGKYSCLRMGADGYPYVSYYDNGMGDLKYSYYNGSSWVTTILDSQGDVGLYPSLTFDSKNHPHITYYDNTNGDLKYAYYNGTDWGIETLDSTGDVGYYPSIVVNNDDLPQIIYYNNSSDKKYLKFAFTYLLSPPRYIEPENDSFSPVDVTLSWYFGNIERDGILSYDVYLDTVGAETRIAKDILSNSHSISNLEYDKVYYWRIVAYNKNKDEAKGPVWKFRTIIAGDIDANGIVDGSDLLKFANSFGSTKGFNLYDNISDIDRNGRIDGADLMILGMGFGRSSKF